MSLDRPPLDAERLQASLTAPWTSLTVVEQTSSTNNDLVGASTGSVLVAEHQLSGRGRLDRRWTSPPRAGLTFSVLLRPTVPLVRWGWLPLLAGVALVDVVQAAGAVAALKWPNDLLVGPLGAPTANPPARKAAGILAQVDGDAVVLGIGLNVTTTRAELPVPTATSLRLEGGAVDRAGLLGAILAMIGERYQVWLAAGGDADRCGLAAAYRAVCATIGEDVVVSGIDGSGMRGRAVGVDSDGRLRVLVDGTERVVAAGDVQHLRLAG